MTSTNDYSSDEFVHLDKTIILKKSYCTKVRDSLVGLGGGGIRG